MGKLAQVLRWGMYPHAETILIVEPDQVLRSLEENALSRKYKIVQTSGPEEAVRVAARHRTKLDLLLTSVRFPNMDGWELTELLKLDYPRLNAIYVSASIEDTRWRNSPRAVIVLAKDQLSASRLLQAVQDTLEAPTQNRRTVRDDPDSLFSSHRSAKPRI
jgi:CheY-like chemotaxis protein